MIPMRMLLLSASLAVLAGCGGGLGGGGSRTTPQTGAGLPPELVFARSRVGSELSDSQIVLRTARNLGGQRVGDRTGRELDVAVDPTGTRVVFARERQAGEPASRDLFVAPLDNSAAELRLLQTNEAEDGPRWSPDGSRILFSAERGGERRLWTVGADGADPREFLAAPAATIDRDPDWHHATNRIVFHRRSSDGRGRLMLVNGDGTGLVPLTDGLSGAPGTGDVMPAFAPDGRTVAFVRREGPSRGRLLQVALDTGAVTVLLDPDGDVARPRWSPSADRVFLALSQPGQGRPGLRLARVLADGTNPALLLPDERLQCDGIDVLATMAPEPAADAPVALDPADAEVQLAAGRVLQGNPTLLRAPEGAALTLATQTFERTEIAGINVKFTLPVADAADVLELRVRARCAVSRTDADTWLRLTLHNPVEGRFDTVTELQPGGTGLHTLAFAVASLAHVTRERQVRVGVIGEIGAGARAEFAVDHLELVLVRRTAPAPAARLR